MPTDTHVVVSINVDGIPRKLFTAQQRSSGDITIIVKQGLARSPAGTYNTGEQNITIEDRYSVHNSSESDTVNAIKHTAVLASGARQHHRNYTKAIKVFKRFAPIFGNRCSDLTNERYLFKQKKQQLVSLGSYDPKRFQLIYQVSTCKRSLPIFLFGQHDLNYTRIDFKDFSLIVMWSYMSIISDSTSHRITYKTFDDNEKKAYADCDFYENALEVERGFEELELAGKFRMIRNRFINLYCQGLYNDMKDKNLQIIYNLKEMMSDHFAVGFEDMPLYQEHVRKWQVFFIFND